MAFINILKEALFLLHLSLIFNSYESVIGPCDLRRKCLLPVQVQHIQGGERQQLWLQAVSLWSRLALYSGQLSSPWRLFDLAFAGEALGGGADADIVQEAWESQY